MSLPLRITSNGRDYTYMVLTRGIDRDTTAIRMGLMGGEFTLVRNTQQQWYPAETTIGDGDHTNLLQAVAKTVELRYRL